jgi:hypothetical protein
MKTYELVEALIRAFTLGRQYGHQHALGNVKEKRAIVNELDAHVEETVRLAGTEESKS